MRPTLVAVVAILCQAFTPPRPGWADDSRSPPRISSSALRAGTIVGHSSFAGTEYLALGGVLALGWRQQRLSGELEYDYLTLQSGGSSSVILGEGHRIAANARLDVIRIGRRWVGARSQILLWTELGAGQQWTTWRAPEIERVRAEEAKVLTRRMDTLATRPSRTDTSVGFGWLLDHHSSQATGFPARIGWLVGWRITRSAGIADVEPQAMCVTDGCRPPAGHRSADRGLLIHSSMIVTW